MHTFFGIINVDTKHAFWRKTMLQKVKRWGHSLAIRIPASLARELHIEPDCEVDLRVEDGKLLIVPISKRKCLQELVDAINENNLHKEVEWGEVEGNEIW